MVREIITENVNPETGEITKVSNFREGLLYGLYAVISNKTVRENEKFYVRWRNKDKSVPGKEMVRTNRGYFIDGYNVDEKSIQMWFNLTGNNRSWRPKTTKYETRKRS